MVLVSAPLRSSLRMKSSGPVIRRFFLSHPTPGGVLGAPGPTACSESARGHAEGLTSVLFQSPLLGSSSNARDVDMSMTTIANEHKQLLRLLTWNFEESRCPSAVEQRSAMATAAGMHSSGHTHLAILLHLQTRVVDFIVLQRVPFNFFRTYDSGRPDIVPSHAVSPGQLRWCLGTKRAAPLTE